MQRYRTIDGLRGYAALAVALYHLTKQVREELSVWCPWAVMQIFEFGFLGVPVFFVISGFAIGASVSETAICRRYFGNFALRRSLRLDPPYWAAILLSIGLLWAKNQYLHGEETYPTIGVVIAHLFYLQHILGFPDEISLVFWTLCQEVQLYLFYILVTWLSQGLTRQSHHRTDQVAMGLMAAFAVYSLACDHRVLTMPNSGLFFANWHYFFIGVLCLRVLKRRNAANPWFLLWMTVEILFQTTHEWRAYAVCGILTGALVWAAIRTQRLDSLLTDRVSLYLGSISYSLYLVHCDLGWKIVSLSKSKLNTADPFQVSLALLVAVGVCIVVADLLYRTIERPSMRCSARFRKSWPNWTDTPGASDA